MRMVTLGINLPGVTHPEIAPAPTAEEAAAILAAVEVLWPNPLALHEVERDPSLSWRFSGRWWQRDRFASAERPWR